MILKILYIVFGFVFQFIIKQTHSTYCLVVNTSVVWSFLCSVKANSNAHREGVTVISKAGQGRKANHGSCPSHRAAMTQLQVMALFRECGSRDVLLISQKLETQIYLKRSIFIFKCWQPTQISSNVMRMKHNRS